MTSTLFGLIFGGMPGHLEILIIAGIVLLLFGNRLPGTMRSLGRSVVEFKKGIKGVEDEVDNTMKAADEAAQKESNA